MLSLSLPTTPRSSKTKKSLGIDELCIGHKQQDGNVSAFGGTSSPVRKSMFDDSLIVGSALSPPRKRQNQTPNNNNNNNNNMPCSPTPDRYIANRACIDFDVAYQRLITADENSRPGVGAGTNASTQAEVGAAVSGGGSSSPKRTAGSLLQVSTSSNATRSRLAPVFLSSSQASVTGSGKQLGPGCVFSSIKGMCDGGDASSMSGITSSPIKGLNSPNASKRFYPTGPVKVLDAPDLVDDYYLNLLHWGGSNDVLAIALQQSVYLYKYADGSISQLQCFAEQDESYVTSVQWSAGNTLAIGTSNADVQVWDASRLIKVRDLTASHANRVSSLAWNDSNFLSSGGRDGAIFNHDVRSANSVQSKYIAHQQEVCGLAWSHDGSTLASGGNENLLMLWDASASSAQGAQGGRRGLNSSNAPRLTLDAHKAAVRALSWCPWQRSTLASGGGTADRTIRVWNTSTGACLRSVDTGSQVCALQWMEANKELVSSHGFSDNQLCIWKVPSSASSTLTKMHELRGHTARVLHLTQSPVTGMLASASADETLRFWDLGDSSSKKNGCRSPFSSLSSGGTLR